LGQKLGAKKKGKKLGKKGQKREQPFFGSFLGGRKKVRKKIALPAANCHSAKNLHAKCFLTTLSQCFCGMAALKEIARRIRRCRRCPLWETRRNAVPGEGPVNADVFFVGQAPGRREDLLGKPFVGAAGKFLDGLLEMAALPRERVFITSVLKCFPPSNRPPRQGEMRACRKWLLEQIGAVSPRVIVLLGNSAIRQLLGGGSAGKLHGKLIKRERAYFVTFHPAAGMRFPPVGRKMRGDFKRLGLLWNEERRNRLNLF
jgi:DNA polymerase